MEVNPHATHAMHATHATGTADTDALAGNHQRRRLLAAASVRWDRRQVLRRAGALGVAAVGLPGLLAACGGDDDDTGDESDTAASGDTTPDSSTGVGNALAAASPDAADSDSGTTTSETPGQVQSGGASSGRLRIAAGFLPATLDPVQDGYTLVQYGMAETFMRVTAEAQIEPWLAEGLEATDASGSAWRITLRDNARFWDGTPVTAEAVQAAFTHIWETNPAAADYLDPATTVTVVDEQTIDLQLPTPQPTLANQLATFHLLIARAGDDVSTFIATGPYQITAHTPEDRLQLVAFPEHWSGTPPIAEIDLRLVRDANARVLALQSGEADMATEVPAELAGGLGGEIEVVSGPSQRMHFIIPSHTRLPLSDSAVRAAMSLAIDRDVLNTLTLAGLGTVASSVIPPGVGITTPQELTTDRERAAALLDEAGWLATDGDVREKDGTRLGFTLYTYARRPELVPIAVSIQDQLREVGFALEVQQVEDIVALLEGEPVDAAMFSMNVLPTGDPFYALERLVGADADYNYLGYANTDLQELVATLGATGDPDERAELALQAMEIMRTDTSQIYLLAAPRITALRAGVVEGHQHHPNDLYMIDTQLRIAE